VRSKLRGRGGRRLGASGRALLAAALLALLLNGAASAAFRAYKPPPGKSFFGVSDNGRASGFRNFARTVGKHPPVIETYHPWENSLNQAIPRWREVRARPILHISTVDQDGREVISPRGIAVGKGDEYLLRLNRRFTRAEIPAYIRPLGEPNRCLNAYAAVDCSGSVRGGRYSHHWYRKAFRRIYILVHGGGRRWEINRRLDRLGLPGIRRGGGREPRKLPKAPLSVIWSPLPGGSPGTGQNRPGHFWPGSRWVDWVGTDFYARYPHWKDLRRFYRRFAKRPGKPFALTEWGLWGFDSPGFVRRVFTFARTHRHTRMLVYYQDFGTSNPFRIQNFPASLRVLQRRLDSRRWPAFAPDFPEPLPSSGGVRG
jgi:hypothetical protein